MRCGDEIFMQYVLAGFWSDMNMGAAISAAEKGGFDINDSRFSKVLLNVRFSMSTRVWLASLYEPVSTMMLDRKPVDLCFKKWVVTKAVRARPIQKPKQSHLNKTLQAVRLGRQEYRKGWLAKHDWNTCK